MGYKIKHEEFIAGVTKRNREGHNNVSSSLSHDNKNTLFLVNNLRAFKNSVKRESCTRRCRYEMCFVVVFNYN